jgi:hypothetical protein
MTGGFIGTKIGTDKGEQVGGATSSGGQNTAEYGRKETVGSTKAG